MNTQWLSSLADKLMLAEQGNASMGRRFRQSGIDVQDLLLLGAGLVVGALLIYGAKRWMSWRSRYHASHASGVYRELCSAHGLNWRERRLLQALARVHQLETPAQLFVEPQRFAVEHAAPSLKRHAQRLASLRQRLFSKTTGESD